MFSVRFEPTPNPATLKFSVSTKIADDGYDFPSVAETDRSPLAAKLFGFPWTQSVFIGPDFITVTKQDWVDWDVLAEPLAGLIKEHLEQGSPVIVEMEKGAAGSNDESESDSPIIKQIKQILNREIRPVIALDGGDVAFVKYEEQILFLQMKGSCVGCPSSAATLKEGIEVRMKELIPEIRSVVSSN